MSSCTLPSQVPLEPGSSAGLQQSPSPSSGADQCLEQSPSPSSGADQCLEQSPSPSSGADQCLEQSPSPSSGADQCLEPKPCLVFPTAVEVWAAANIFFEQVLVPEVVNQVSADDKHTALTEGSTNILRQCVALNLRGRVARGSRR